MGNSLKCNACTPAVNHSVFTFSEDLVMKITEDRPPRGLSDAEFKALENEGGDEEIFRELRCIDDTHTQAYGLSPSRVELMLQHLERVVDDLSVRSDPCASDGVAKCFEYNKECPNKCAEQVAEYDQCVDEVARDRVQKSLKEKDKC